jgi:hypothetical protein
VVRLMEKYLLETPNRTMLASRTGPSICRRTNCLFSKPHMRRSTRLYASL